jgi:GT2 family glycosyltransferase
MVIISKDAFLMTGGFDENLKKAQEHDLNLRLSTNGFKFKYVNFHGVYSRIHHSPYRISNQKLAGTEINEFYFFDKIKKYINQYSNKKEHQRKCLIELIKLVIFRSQQFGNSKLFLIVEKFEEYINILKNGNNLKNKEICYKGKIYNFLLFNIGLTTFEKLRQIPNKLRS